MQFRNSEIRKNAAQAARPYKALLWGAFLLLALAYQLPATIVRYAGIAQLAEMSVLIGALLPCLVVSTLFHALTARGYAVFTLAAVNDGEPQCGLLNPFAKGSWRSLLLSFLVGIKVFLWSLLLIVPGFIAAYRYSMSLYIMAEKPEYGIRRCIAESCRLTDGMKMKLFKTHMRYLLICMAISTAGTVVLLIAAIAGMVIAKTIIRIDQLPLFAAMYFVVTTIIATLTTAYVLKNYQMFCARLYFETEQSKRESKHSSWSVVWSSKKGEAGKRN